MPRRTRRNAAGAASRHRPAPAQRSRPARILADPPDATALDLVDHLLNKGVTLTGDVTLGVAGVDLIYLRLSALLSALDRVMPTARVRRRTRPGPTRS